MTNVDATSLLLMRRRPQQLRILRTLVKNQLYPGGSTSQPPDTKNDPLTQLANTFSRYASTQSTAYDNGAARTSATSSSNTLERQVERAISQVLGRSPGRGGDSFMGALNAAFPTNGNGQVTAMPSRSAVSLYGSNGTDGTSVPIGALAAGLAGQISSEQASLYRQARVIADDALRVLDGLKFFVPLAESDKVEALRSLVRSEIQTLVDEFGRIDEPRSQRVESYLTALNGPNGHLRQLGQRAFLNRGATPATLDDESQIAGFELLSNYVGILRTIWNRYNKPSRSIDFPLFSERLSRASVLLPVIAEGNNNFMAAMDSIGFTEAERRSSATKFSTLGHGRPRLPEMTVNDLNEWIDRFASSEGPSMLADSGQYGLEFVADQADRIFWVIAPILAHVKTTGTFSLNSMPIVAQALVHERVSWSLDDMFSQLGALADLAAPHNQGPRPRVSQSQTAYNGSGPQ